MSEKLEDLKQTIDEDLVIEKAKKEVIKYYEDMYNSTLEELDRTRIEKVKLYFLFRVNEITEEEYNAKTSEIYTKIRELEDKMKNYRNKRHQVNCIYY
jgi:ABC-type phosphate transport system auxiliary subunit